jgi:hypothetical protein
MLSSASGRLDEATAAGGCAEPCGGEVVLELCSVPRSLLSLPLAPAHGTTSFSAARGCFHQAHKVTEFVCQGGLVCKERCGSLEADHGVVTHE